MTQMAYLNEWVVLESDHIDGLFGVVEDLEASTLRHPLIGGAKPDIEHLKHVIYSAADAIQTMGSAIYPLLSQVEGMNKLIYEVVVVSSREKAMLDEWKALIEFCDRYVGKSHDIWLKNLNGSSKKLDKDATTFPRYTGDSSFLCSVSYSFI
ncbi:AUGMIN subunit 8 [Glycine soja]